MRTQTFNLPLIVQALTNLGKPFCYMFKFNVSFLPYLITLQHFLYLLFDLFPHVHFSHDDNGVSLPLMTCSCEGE